MAELEKELSEILSDKDSIQKLQKMAQSLFPGGFLGGSEGAKTEGGGTALPPLEPDKNIPDFPFDINKLLRVSKALKEGSDDHAVQLINALIPYLENERKQRAYTVVKILRLFSAVPALKESGILDDRF